MARWRRTTAWAACLLVVLAWAAWLRPVGLGGPATLIRVSGASMEPTLTDGDLVLVHRAEHYEVGEVVAFRVPEGRVIHRIVGGDGRDGYVLQGDNRDEVDQWRPRHGDVIGREVLRVPGAGRALPALNSLPGRLLMLGLAAWLLLRGEDRPDRPRGRRGAPGGADAAAPRLPRGTGPLVAGAGGVVLLAAALLGGPTATEHREVTSLSQRIEVEVSGTRASTFAQPAPAFGPLSGSDAVDEPFFTATLSTLDVAFTHTAEGLDVHDGTTASHRLLLEVEGAQGGWRRRLELVPTTRAEGVAFTATASLSLAEVRSLLGRASAELGVVEREHVVRVVPVVVLHGLADGRTERWEAAGLQLRVAEQRIEVLPDDGANRRSTTTGVPLTRGRSVAGLPWPLAIAAGLLLAAAGAWVGRDLLLEMVRSPESDGDALDRASARPERVPARSPVLPNGTVVDVADLSALLRTARSLHLPVVVEDDGVARRHWVLDGAVAYRVQEGGADAAVTGTGVGVSTSTADAPVEGVRVIDLSEDAPGTVRFRGSDINFTAS